MKVIVFAFVLAGLAVPMTSCTTQHHWTAAELAKAKASDEAMLEQGHQQLLKEGYVDWDASNLTTDQVRAIAVAKGVAANQPGMSYLFKVEHRDDGWYVGAMPWGGHDSDGWPVMPLGFFMVYISNDWKEIRVTGGV